MHNAAHPRARCSSYREIVRGTRYGTDYDFLPLYFYCCRREIFRPRRAVSYFTERRISYQVRACVRITLLLDENMMIRVLKARLIVIHSVLTAVPPNDATIACLSSHVVGTLRLIPLRTPVPLWGHTTQIPSKLSSIVPKTRLQC